MYIYSAVPLLRSRFSENVHERHLVARRLGRDMGASFVNSNLDLYPVKVSAVMYLRSCHFGPLYSFSVSVICI